MKNITKRISTFVLCILLLFVMNTVPALANSAQSKWEGVDSTGAIVTDKESPIVVEKELLTFDITEFPQNYYHTKEELETYKAKVTAEYTFYNPSDYTVTATLLFPFGHLPAYADSYYDDESGEMLWYDDISRFDVTVNRESVDKTVRHTFSYMYDQFVLDRDMSLLSNGFAADDFYSPELTVTKYTFKISGVDTEKYQAADAAFDLPKGLGGYRVYLPEQCGSHLQKDGDLRITTWVQKNEREFDLYVFGTPPSTMPDWKIYENGGVEDNEVIAGSVSLVKNETMTFKDFALKNREEKSPVSESDWYNAVVAELNLATESSEHPIAHCDSVSGFDTGLMRWYEYEITLAPGERIVNAVTAPLYPAIDLGYEPDIFKYTYLLSPAKTWKSFGELEIVINTPYYVSESSIDGFTKTENGYTLKLNGLPDGELEFTLSTSENPQKPPRTIKDYFPIEIIINLSIISLSIIGGALLLLGGGITVFLIISKKNRKK